ncbi:MAG: hypothetical protein WD823_05750 [Sulfuricaulis sp.]|uniref:hypothetical protein n=1 Tax=Sulfuricaulis sp. TaxID=2003553 RepID=UPI0034A48EEC
MSIDLPTPPVPDLARAKGETLDEVIDWFVDFYNQHGAPFNYRRATRATRAGYRGLHEIRALVAGCLAEKTAIGRTANTDVVNLAAPLAFGRRTQVFDLSPRRFSFGRSQRSAYRVPFFFVENEIIKLYFLQPRKAAGLTFDELCMVATIVKRYLLDVEFYGERCDIEFVDVGVPLGAANRAVRRYSLATMPLWSERRLADRLTLIAEALEMVARADRVERRPRLRARPEPDMPLFD